MLIFLRNILQLTLSASKGWEDVSGSLTDPAALVKRRLFPLTALAGVSVFAQMLYHSETRFPEQVVKALAVSVSLFVTFYLALVLFKTYAQRFCEGEPNERKLTTVIAYTLCLLAISTIICNVMPVSMGLEYLLPIAVVLIFWKSYVYLRVRPTSEFSFLVFGILTLILPPLLIQALFNHLL